MDGGSKTIDRVGSILAVLERDPATGMTSGQIAAATGFDKATAYRALVSMARIGLVDRDEQTRHFRLGIYLFKLGAVAARRFSVLSHAREVMTRIAQETGDTVFLSVRNKYDSVCIDCATGSYPIKAQTMAVGESVPLGVSTGGLAMLATMSDDDVRHAVQYNAIAIARFRTIRPEDIYGHVEETRRRGYAHYAGHVIAGMGGIGLAIRGANGAGIAVLSVTALLDRMPEQRLRYIGELLEHGVREIEQRALLLGSRLETLS